MRFTVNFLISPKPELIGAIENANDRSLLDIVEPLLWSHEELAGLPDAARRDLDALVKILFVDMIMRDHADQPAFAQLFNELSASISCFDKNWTLIRVRCDTSVNEALQESVENGSIESMLPTGNDVLDEVLTNSKNRWLEKSKQDLI